MLKENFSIRIGYNSFIFISVKVNQAIQNLFSNVLQQSLRRRTELASQQQNIDFVSRPLQNCKIREGHRSQTNVECVYLDISLKSGRLSFSTPFGAPPWARITWAQALEPLPSWTSDRWWRLRWRTTGRASCCRRRRCWRWCRRPEEMTCYQM